MSKLLLKCESKKDCIWISKVFIKEYMPKSSGEFLKIYLYLLAALSDDLEVSVSAIADTFDLTEKDVIRALNYWKNEGIIDTETDGDKLVALTFLPIKRKSEDKQTESTAQITVNAQSSAAVRETAVTRAPSTNVPEKVPYSASEIDKITSDESFYEIQAMTETFLGRPLTRSEIESITYIIDKLAFSVSIFESLLDFCYKSDKKSIKYLEKIAITWYDKGYKTAQEASAGSVPFKKAYGTVMNAFGINGTGRVLNLKERQYVDKWSNDYRMPEELIEEACLKTIESTNRVSFSYADSILTRWKDSGVKNLSDAKKQSSVHFAKVNAVAKNTKPAVGSITTFTNISKSDQDFELIEVNNTRKQHGLAPLTRDELEKLKVHA